MKQTHKSPYDKGLKPKEFCEAFVKYAKDLGTPLTIEEIEKDFWDEMKRPRIKGVDKEEIKDKYCWYKVIFEGADYKTIRIAIDLMVL